MNEVILSQYCILNPKEVIIQLGRAGIPGFILISEDRAITPGRGDLDNDCSTIRDVSSDPSVPLASNVSWHNWLTRRTSTFSLDKIWNSIQSLIYFLGQTSKSHYNFIPLPSSRGLLLLFSSFYGMWLIITMIYAMFIPWHPCLPITLFLWRKCNLFCHMNYDTLPKADWGRGEVLLVKCLQR